MVRGLLLLSLFTALAPAAEPIAFKQIRVGKLIVSLPPQWRSLSPEIPLWLHLHGAPATVESNFASIGAPGVLANVTLPELSKVYADYFAEPRVFSELLREVDAALRAEWPDAARSWRLGRLTISSFSAGFGGVRQLLRQPEAFARIDALVMADSIYCGYTGDPAEKRVDPGLMSGFLRFARLAAEGKRRFVISHSRQIPDGYASTTETADYLIRQLGGERVTAGEASRPDLEEWPAGLRLLTRFTRGRVEILGFDGDAPEDHIRHLRGIGALLQRARDAQ